MKDIILVDEVTQSMIKHNPQEINPSYETAIATELDKNCYIRPYSGNKSGQNITIAEYVALKRDTFAQYIVSSGLYKNVYFEAKNFDKQYWEEYVNILAAFVTILGGGSVLDVYCKTECIENVSDKNTKSGSLFGMLKGKTQTETSKTISNEKQHLKHLTANNPKCSKKDIEQWIEQEKINVDALPMHLRTLIKKFLAEECLEGEYSETERECATTMKMINKIKSLKIDANTSSWFKRLRKPPFSPFKAINTHIESLQKTFKKVEIKKEIKVEAHFKHNGVKKTFKLF